MSQLLRRLVVLQPGEAPVVLVSLATLLCTFSSYTMLRPVRDALGVTSGLEKIPYLFWGVFLAMLLLQPVYGWLTSRYARSVFLPWVYGFFVVNLLLFWFWFHVQADHTWIARTYYVWVSVFNLFVVAAFWSLMADVFTREQAGRVFGFIWAGASAGGLIGPFLDRVLALRIGAINLLPISAGLLFAGLLLMMRVIRWQRGRVVAAVAANAPAPRVEHGVGGGVLAAFSQVARSPYLIAIAVFVFFMTWVSTFFYLEQQSFVAKAFHNADERAHFFATIDFAVQGASLLLQALLFSRLFKWFGMRALLMAVPLMMIGAYALYALVPTFIVLNWMYGIRRVADYGITRPCRDSLFTVVSREEKYQAKSLIDTFAYRGGDALSGSLYKAFTAGFSAGHSAVGWLGAAVSALWMLLALALGGAFQQRAQRAIPPSATESPLRRTESARL
jgi:AAA family ATP:ADP antiporter